jgi:DNA-binding transcriptional regulator YhcF (GntR family)
MILNKSENIERDILESIYSGRYADKLPSEKDLAKAYNTTPVTMAKILNRLKDKKVVNRIGGKGTFVNSKALQRKVKMHLGFVPEMLSEIKLELERQFPQITFEFQDRKERSLDKLADEMDIVFMTSYFPDFYGKYFAPLPEDLLEDALNEEKYYSEFFLPHSHEHLFYGVPYCASPCLLGVNKDLLGKYFDAGSCLSLDELFELNEKLKEEDVALFDVRFLTKGMVLDLIFSRIQEGELDRRNLKNVPSEAVIKGVNLLKELFEDSIKKRKEFNKGGAVFSKVCRQSLMSRFSNLDFSWDIMTASFGDLRLSVIASESLLVSAKASNQERLFEICRAFLSPGIQNIICKYKYGIPVLKSAALKSMDSNRFRDDFFFNEINNAVFKYELFEKPLMNLFISEVEDYFMEKISFDSLLATAGKLCALNEKSQEIKDRFANECDF